VKADGRFKVHIRPEDFVLPACHEGMNRSQVMYLVLQGLKRGYVLPGMERIGLPHGAESGFDPYQAYENVNAENIVGYLHGICRPRGSGGDWVRFAVVPCNLMCCVNGEATVCVLQLHEQFYVQFGVDKRNRIGQARALVFGRVSAQIIIYRDSLLLFM
jgi:hypothetical protein